MRALGNIRNQEMINNSTDIEIQSLILLNDFTNTLLYIGKKSKFLEN